MKMKEELSQSMCDRNKVQVFWLSTTHHPESALWPMRLSWHVPFTTAWEVFREASLSSHARHLALPADSGQHEDNSV